MKPNHTLFSRLGRFTRDEDGAITVDWVVLSAAVIGLAIAMGTVVGGATDDHSDRVGSAMSTRGVVSY
jgi:Flp pilus assembly pilin Flp